MKQYCQYLQDLVHIVGLWFAKIWRVWAGHRCTHIHWSSYLCIALPPYVDATIPSSCNWEHAISKRQGAHTRCKQWRRWEWWVKHYRNLLHISLWALSCMQIQETWVMHSELDWWVINIPANTTALVRRGATAPANTTAPVRRGAAATLQEAQWPQKKLWSTYKSKQQLAKGWLLQNMTKSWTN